MNFGITLSNRAVPLGLCSARDLLALADAVEACPLLDSVWCGDALFVNPRLDALTLLAAVAGRTERVLIGPACMGSFALRNPLVFAYEWASLDVLSNGRTRLVVCAGGGAGPVWEAESAALNIAPGERRKRMIENIHVLRHLWTKDNAPFVGQFTNFSNVTLEPKPVQNPCPIWLATNAERLSKGQADSGGSEIALTRVGKLADGWMTHSVSPEGFRRRRHARAVTARPWQPWFCPRPCPCRARPSHRQLRRGSHAMSPRSYASRLAVGCAPDRRRASAGEVHISRRGRRAIARPHPRRRRRW